MQRNTSVTLGDHLGGFVENKIQQGRFESTSETVRAGLRLLEEHEAQKSWNNINAYSIKNFATKRTKT